VICRHSPAFTRSTMGRGRRPGRRCASPVAPGPPELFTTSCSSANISASGALAPSRLYQMNCSKAATRATLVREHCACSGAAVAASSSRSASARRWMPRPGGGGARNECMGDPAA